ncbi:helix-turn-helix transcriptional regulator [Catenovulum sediminis]|uniref:helix-turn-helix transcriptional regulator n=1 Tax=Catenovulum sediminis TaxID=1740262 RepID=UPI00117F9C45|nr:AlpA family phage regulatory protein [Catenovulum sediminis]
MIVLSQIKCPLSLDQNTNTSFFGYQLVEYLVEQVQAIEAPNKAYESNPERIIDTNMVQELTGLSRSTLWRLETRGEFPRRVALSTARVGWRYHEVIDWLNSR